MTTLIATDLDRTLIYSAAAIDEDTTSDLEAVERHEDRDVSWMTASAAACWATLPGVIVPVTTRTPEQWRRIRLPGPVVRYAITANGGVLLVDGAPDRDWDAHVAAQLTRVAPLAEIWAHAGRICQPEWTVKLRNAHGLFCYAVLHRRRLPPGFLAEAAAWADVQGWRLSLQGRKLYWVPQPLTKSAAVAEVARRAGTHHTLAAGDSLLDADLLEAADAGIVARHGELVASGWARQHVAITSSSGIRAGEQIVRWFADRAR